MGGESIESGGVTGAGGGVGIEKQEGVMLGEFHFLPVGDAVSVLVGVAHADAEELLFGGQGEAGDIRPQVTVAGSIAGSASSTTMTRFSVEVVRTMMAPRDVWTRPRRRIEPQPRPLFKWSAPTGREWPLRWPSCPGHTV